MEVRNDGSKTSTENVGRESHDQGRRAHSANRTSGESVENRDTAAERLGSDMLSKRVKMAEGENLRRPFQSGRNAVSSTGLRPGSNEPGSKEPAGRVYEHPEKRTELSELKGCRFGKSQIDNLRFQISNPKYVKGLVMEKSGLKVYSIIVRDTRKYTKSKRFNTIALCSEQAVALTKTKAGSCGFKHFDVDQLTCLGDIDAAPWLEGNESEVEQCQQ